VPIHSDEVRKHGSLEQAVLELIRAINSRMYENSTENEFLEVTYTNGEKETLYFHDFNSGAMIENIVSRAKKYAIKNELATGERGILTEHLMRAAYDELLENEDLPNTTNPDDWAKISGRKGQPIVYMRTLVHTKDGSATSHSIPPAS